MKPPKITTVRRFPHQVRSESHVWIPMSDGTRLAGRIWRPEGSERSPVPAILEYIPYRQGDKTAPRDARNHPYFAGHGYASVRVDLRGSGNSEGVLEDEYLQQELDDGVEVLRWITAQPWCNGNIGMIGISWGGFNGLQIAAMRPPELKAVISVCSTDDRYADDVHHMGGCMLGDNLSWASTMFAYNSLPPDPDVVGWERWREMWLERLEGSGLWLEKWLAHQRRDDYWKHGSICEDFSAVQCPVMLVSGWADGYSNAVFRMLEGLRVPRMGLVGPWSHMYPHMGIPGPAIGFLQEAVRWWDRWLKGERNGIDDEPMLRAWMQRRVPATAHHAQRPGRWVSEPSWPSPNIHWQTEYFGPGWLTPSTDDISEIGMPVQSPLSVGLFAGKWCSYSATPDLPHDQREEDGGALIFDTERLSEPLEILGAPEVELELEADKPVAMVAVRLSDVRPDDRATRVTYGLLNLCHRNSHAHPEPLEPGERYRVRVQLNDVAQTFLEGHRLRLSLSTSYWPLAWPPPEPVRLTIYTVQSALHLPVRVRHDEDQPPELGRPESAKPMPVSVVEPGRHTWLVTRDLAEDKSTLEVINDEGTYRLEDLELDVLDSTLEDYSYVADQFDSVRGETLCTRGFSRPAGEVRERRADEPASPEAQAAEGEERPAWEVKTRTRTVLTSDSEHFHIFAELDAYHGDERVYCRSWRRTIRRDYV